MGIGITSNGVPEWRWRYYPDVSIPNGDRHYLEPSSLLPFDGHTRSFNPQWG